MAARRGIKAPAAPGGLTWPRILVIAAAALFVGFVLSSAFGGGWGAMSTAVRGSGSSSKHVHDESLEMPSRSLSGKKGGVESDSPDSSDRACERPPSTALARAFKGEGFRVEKIVQEPGLDDWRLCYPGPAKMDGTPAPAVCPTTSFFVVNQRDGVSDGVVDWLQGAEEHVMDLFSAVLSTKLKKTCALRPADPHCFVTAGSFPASKRHNLMFMDIGSNHGFFSGYAAGAAPFIRAVAFEPQPQCAEFIEIAVEASGFRDRILVLNNLAGTTALATPPEGVSPEPRRLGRFLVPPTSEAFVPIPARTGCRGTWPTYLPEEQAAVHRQYGSVPGALDPLNVTYVDPGTLVGEEDVVLLAKVDVEGFEEEVLDSLEPLIKRGKLYNILMELNKPQKARRLKRDPSNLADPVVVDWVIKMLKRLQGLGYTIVPQWGGYKKQQRLGTSDGEVRALAESGWNSVDIWCYKPLDVQHDESAHDAELEAAAQAEAEAAIAAEAEAAAELEAADAEAEEEQVERRRRKKEKKSKKSKKSKRSRHAEEE